MCYSNATHSVLWMTTQRRDTLQLIRKDDNDALFRTAAAGAGKVVLDTYDKFLVYKYNGGSGTSASS